MRSERNGTDMEQDEPVDLAGLLAMTEDAADTDDEVVSEPDPSRGGGGKGLGTILHSSCPQVGMLT